MEHDRSPCHERFFSKTFPPAVLALESNHRNIVILVVCFLLGGEDIVGMRINKNASAVDQFAFVCDM
jgi:hypothetical protein